MRLWRRSGRRLAAVLAVAAATATVTATATAGWRPLQQPGIGAAPDYPVTPGFDAAGTAYVGVNEYEGNYFLSTHPFGGDWTEPERYFTSTVPWDDSYDSDLAVAADGTSFGTYEAVYREGTGYQFPNV